MTIVKMDEIIERAFSSGYAVGYFECWDQYSLEGAIEAAEESLSPAILGFGGAVTNSSWLEGGGIEELTALAHILAERASVPAAVLFNEAATVNQLTRGLKAGCNAVMLDSSYYPYEENLRITTRVAKLAHDNDAWVEAELGHLPDANDLNSNTSLTTDPDQAAAFVAATQVDALAISIGNIHSLPSGESPIDLDLLDRIHQCTSIPLVIHGGSGFPHKEIRSVIERGVAKFNYGTRLKQLFLEGVRSAVDPIPETFIVHDYVGSRNERDVMASGKALMKEDILKMTRLYGSAGKAANW